MGLPGGPSLDTELIRKIRQGPLPGVPDAELGLALAQLLHDELQIYGTSGGQSMTDEDLRDALPALKAVCSRLGITYNVPSRDFTDFRSYWGRKGASGPGGWQARRDLLMSIFGPMGTRVPRVEARQRSMSDSAPISPQRLSPRDLEEKDLLYGIYTSLRTIKRIMVFFTVLWAVALIGGIIFAAALVPASV